MGLGSSGAANFRGKREGEDDTIELLVSQVGGEFGGVGWDDFGTVAGQTCRACGKERQIIADQ
jgi:hypothetical protein